MKPGRTPIVVVGDDWGRHVSTIQHLFRRVIGQFPLVWVNSIGQRRPRLTVYDVKRAAAKVVAMASSRPANGAVTPGPMPDQIVHPKALPWHDMAAVRSFNSWSLSRDIRKAVERVSPGERPLLVCSSPVAYGLIGRLNEIASIYYCMDDYGQIHGTDQDMLEPLEQEMLSRVDALVATAASLTVKRRPASGRTLHLPQGVNFEHFSTVLNTPADIAGLPRPILGFAGGVGPAVDFQLIRDLAAAFPEGSIAMIGPHQQDVTTEHWASNIHFLGPRSYATLPAYVQAFDVGLVPYVHNDWTQAVDPLKLLEYLAAGIPVVSTGLAEASKYSSVVNVADGSVAFTTAVREAIQTNDSESRATRRQLASENRWEARANRFLSFADTVAAECSE